MKLSKHSWHYRLSYYIYGYDYFFDNHAQYRTKSLCPYCRRLVLAMAMFPWVVCSRAMPPLKWPRKFKPWMINGSIGIFDLALGANDIIGGHYESAAWMIGLGVFMFASSRIFRFIVGWLENRPYTREADKPKVKKAKNPNVWVEIIKAKHHKICPLLEFVD